MSVLVVLEQQRGGWHRACLDALAAGRQLADSLALSLHAAVLGPDRIPDDALTRGVDKLYWAPHPLLADYTQEAYTLALQQIIEQTGPNFVVFPHTYQVRDYAPRLAAKYQCSLIGDVFRIDHKDGHISFVRQIFLGKLLSEVIARSKPAFVSIQAGAFAETERTAASLDRANPASATMEVVNIQLQPEQILSRPEPPFKTLQSALDLKAATTIVAVGRGVKQQEDLVLVDALANQLSAEVAASRPVCDSGLIAMDRLVGSSGQTVAPNLYIAVGISGAIQHLLGMKRSKTIVAINNDPAAPIFDNAHYGIVGDLRAVLPALTDELRKAKS